MDNKLKFIVVIAMGLATSVSASEIHDAVRMF